MKEYADFLQKLRIGAHLGYPVAHRALYSAEEKEPENSLSAIEACIRQGLLFIEIDLRETKDGYLILSHDESLTRMTGLEGNICDLTLAEIKKARLYKGSGESKTPTQDMVPELSELLRAFKDRALFNIDKGWEYREKLDFILRKENAFHQAIVKSNAEIDEAAAFLRSADSQFLYMHKIFNKDMAVLPEMKERLAPKLWELSFFDDAEPLIQPETIVSLKETAGVWINALNVSRNNGHNDALSLREPEKGWGFLLGLKPNYVQTDYADRYLQHYRRQLSL